MAAAVISCLREMQLDISKAVGQRYDGAASMSSERTGLQSRIRQEAPLGMYFHCSGHALNLVIAHSCSLTCVRNMIDKLKQVCLFFRYSPKREGLLMDIIERIELMY